MSAEKIPQGTLSMRSSRPPLAGRLFPASISPAEGSRPTTLLPVSDGKSLWAENYEEKYFGIFALENSIIEKVVPTLIQKLGSGE